MRNLFFGILVLSLVASCSSEQPPPGETVKIPVFALGAKVSVPTQNIQSVSSGIVETAKNTSLSFHVQADAGYQLTSTVTGTCPSGSWSGNVYTVAIQNECTLLFSATVMSYTLTYNGNGNTGGTAPSSSTVVYNSEVTASTTTLVRTGYTFSGWNTAANGSGTNYAAGATFSMPASAVTLYAKWTINSYSLTYNGNNNTGGTVPSSSTPNYNAQVTVPTTTTLVRTGYTFSGWNTAANGSGTNYAAGATFSMPASAVTLYAKWTINSYSLTYNGNGNTGGVLPPSSTVNYNAQVTVATSAPVRTGYTFTGWNTAANGTGTSYGVGANFLMPASAVTLYAQWKNWIGTKQLEGSSSYGKGTATDSNGNVFVVGYAYDGVEGNAQMGTSDLFVTKYSPNGTKLWTRQFGASGAQTVGYATATDASGNVFVVGYTSGSLDGPLTGTYDFFVIKYDPTGTTLWTRQLGAAGAWTYGLATATDVNSNVYVVGYTTSSLDGNTRTGPTDFFVTKYNSSGNKLWTRQLGAAGAWTYGYATATDASGNVFVSGYTNGGLDGNTLTGNYDFFVTKYDSSGNKLWTRQLGAAGAWTYGYATATDASGNVFVAGYTNGNLDGNIPTGNYDFFVTKYDSSGNKVWARQLGASGTWTYGFGAATDSSGNVFVTGYTNGNLDGNTLTGNYDFFITKFSSTGTKLSTRQLGVSGTWTYGYASATDANGNVFVAGVTGGDLEGQYIQYQTQAFVTKFNNALIKQ